MFKSLFFVALATVDSSHSSPSDGAVTPSVTWRQSAKKTCLAPSQNLAGQTLVNDGNKHKRDSEELLRTGNAKLESGNAKLESGNAQIRDGELSRTSGQTLVNEGNEHKRGSEGLLIIGKTMIQAGQLLCEGHIFIDEATIVIERVKKTSLSMPRGCDGNSYVSYDRQPPEVCNTIKTNVGELLDLMRKGQGETLVTKVGNMQSFCNEIWNKGYNLKNSGKRELAAARNRLNQYPGNDLDGSQPHPERLNAKAMYRAAWRKVTEGKRTLVVRTQWMTILKAVLVLGEDLKQANKDKVHGTKLCTSSKELVGTLVENRPLDSRIETASSIARSSSPEK
jgi:exonuclease VII small subunit